MDLKLVISLTLCHYVSARPSFGGDNHDIQRISNLQLLIPYMVEGALTGQESDSSESESSENTSNLSMPIQAFLQHKDEPRYPQPNYAQTQKSLPTDGRFSDIPMEAFQIDRSRNMKKDLSRTPLEAAVSEDLVHQCTGYFGGTIRPTRGKEELILNVCTELFDVVNVKNYPSRDEDEEHALRTDSGTGSQVMNDDEFLKKVRELTREYEKLLQNNADDKSDESMNVEELKKRDDDKPHDNTNLNNFNARDDNVYHEFKDLDVFQKHSDNNIHEFKSLNDQNNVDDNAYHEFENFELKQHDDSNHFKFRNTDEFKGRDAKVPEFKTEDNKHEVRIDVIKPNDVKLVADGETQVHCDCCPHGAHRVKAEVIEDNNDKDDSDKGFQTALQKILGLLMNIQSRQ